MDLQIVIGILIACIILFVVEITLFAKTGEKDPAEKPPKPHKIKELKVQKAAVHKSKPVHFDIPKAPDIPKNINIDKEVKSVKRPKEIKTGDKKENIFTKFTSWIKNNFKSIPQHAASSEITPLNETELQKSIDIQNQINSAEKNPVTYNKTVSESKIPLWRRLMWFYRGPKGPKFYKNVVSDETDLDKIPEEKTKIRESTKIYFGIAIFTVLSFVLIYKLKLGLQFYLLPIIAILCMLLYAEHKRVAEQTNFKPKAKAPKDPKQTVRLVILFFGMILDCGFIYLSIIESTALGYGATILALIISILFVLMYVKIKKPYFIMIFGYLGVFSIVIRGYELVKVMFNDLPIIVYVGFSGLILMDIAFFILTKVEKRMPHENEGPINVNNMMSGDDNDIYSAPPAPTGF